MKVEELEHEATQIIMQYLKEKHSSKDRDQLTEIAKIFTEGFSKGIQFITDKYEEEEIPTVKRLTFKERLDAYMAKQKEGTKS